MRNDTMINKKILVFMLLSMTMLLTACANDDDSPNTTTFIGGDRGLDINFIADAPPESVADRGQQPFDVIVELTNLGEAEIEAEDVQVRLEGFPPSDFGKSVEEMTRNSPELIERRFRVPGEDRVIESPPVFVEFEDFIFEDSAPGDLTYPIRASVCYAYETRASSSLCISENLNRPGENEVCNPSRVTTPSNSGAPVRVTELAQSPGGSDTIRFSFTVENMQPDDGRVFRTNSLCDTDHRNTNNVFVTVSGLETTGEVSCSGLREGTASSGYTSLSDGVSTEVHCRLDVPAVNRNNRVENFIINVGYDYRESIRSDINVRYSLD